MEQAFTKENFEKLKSTCEKIIALSNENVDGVLMASQLMFLAEKIENFIDNPIVKTSGIISKFGIKEDF